MFKISGNLVAHNIDLKVVVCYLLVPDGPFCLDSLALRGMDVERRLWKRVDLLDETGWQNDHSTSVNAGQDEGTV